MRKLFLETMEERGFLKPLTFLEFSYMLLQAVDFRELHKRHGVNMQMGASDQWGNIINGVEIIRRKDGAHVDAFTAPLLLDREDKKMGKSQGKPIWLDPELTSLEIGEIIASKTILVRPGSLVALLAEHKLVESRGVAKRLLAQGGIRIEGEKVFEDLEITKSSIVRVGKSAPVELKVGESE